MALENYSPPPPYSAEHQEKTTHITIAGDSFPSAPPQFQQQPSAPSASPNYQPRLHAVHANIGSFGPLPVEMVYITSFKPVNSIINSGLPVL